MRPLETRLELAAELPVDVAQMVVDGRVFRLELDRAVEMLDRLFVVADAVVGPT